MEPPDLAQPSNRLLPASIGRVLLGLAVIGLAVLGVALRGAPGPRALRTTVDLSRRRDPATLCPGLRCRRGAPCQEENTPRGRHGAAARAGPKRAPRGHPEESARCPRLIARCAGCPGWRFARGHRGPGCARFESVVAAAWGLDHARPLPLRWRWIPHATRLGALPARNCGGDDGDSKGRAHLCAGTVATPRGPRRLAGR